MNTSELKLSIFRMVDGINDQAQLSILYQVLSQYISREIPDTEDHEAAWSSILESLAQLERGEGIPHSEVMAEMRKKYSA